MSKSFTVPVNVEYKKLALIKCMKSFQIVSEHTHTHTQPLQSVLLTSCFNC